MIQAPKIYSGESDYSCRKVYLKHKSVFFKHTLCYLSLHPIKICQQNFKRVIN